LRSRNDKEFNARYPAIVQALAKLPDETVIDGEIVALGSSGKPCFHALRNGAGTETLVYYVFHVTTLAGRDVMNEPLTKRRKLPREGRSSPEREASRPDLTLSERPDPVGRTSPRDDTGEWSPGPVPA
jgi:hypothetical protein